MPENVRYFKLSEEVGVEPDFITDEKTGEPVKNPKAGELQPFTEVKVTVASPVLAGKDLIDVAQEVCLPDPRFGVIADAAERVLKIHDPVVAVAFADHPLYREVEQSSQPRKPKASAGKE